MKAYKVRFMIGLVVLLAYCNMTTAETLTNNLPAGSLPPPPGKAQPAVVDCNWIVGIAILAGFAIICYKLWQFCKTHFPPPPRDPAPPPPTPPATNSPPQTNITGAAFLVPTAWQGHDAFTNEPGLLTNVFDITGYHWTDTNSGQAVPFLWWFSNSIPVQSSADNTHWVDCSMEMYGSAAGVLDVLYDGQGVPLSTNYTASSSNSVGNAQLRFPIGPGMKFYRLSGP